MTQINRTIDVQFEFEDVKDKITGKIPSSCPCSGDKEVDLSVSDVNVSVDLIAYDPSDTEMQVIIGQMLKGDPGKDGYTPQKYIDYWTSGDVKEIHDYTEIQIDESALHWEAL